MTQNTGAFEALLQEDRTYPPPAEFAANANIADPGVYEEALRDPEAFWARFARRTGLVQAVGHGAGLVGRALRQVVRGRQSSTPRTTASTGTWTAPRKNKAGDHLGGRAGRLAGVHLPRPFTGRCASSPTA